MKYLTLLNRRGLDVNARPLYTENMDVETGVDQFGAFATSYTGMRRITTFQSKTDRIYDGGPIILKHYNVIF